MSDELRAVLFTAVGGVLAKLLDTFVQRRRDRATAGVESSKFTWDMAQSLMNQYKADLREVRAELVEMRAQVVDRDRRIDEFETQVITLQNQIVILQSQNREQNMVIETLRAELDSLKGDGK